VNETRKSKGKKKENQERSDYEKVRRDFGERRKRNKIVKFEGEERQMKQRVGGKDGKQWEREKINGKEKRPEERVGTKQPLLNIENKEKTKKKSTVAKRKYEMTPLSTPPFPVFSFPCNVTQAGQYKEALAVMERMSGTGIKPDITMVRYTQYCTMLIADTRSTIVH
jgi:pentatricopeptide repeat protein